ncbi:MAG: dTDP-glucose 4,6-dehydratase [Candidatus Omnitrophica bacterium]|nr:dTDP-glucose 4,6-dehydratase [Candidatus Omnitrophota bacterium]
MKTLLVTGGSGFIGSNFIRRFLLTHNDWKVLNLDLLTYAGNPENCKDFSGNSRYEFIQGDICDGARIKNLMPKANALINFAAETHVDRSIDESQSFLLTNILGLKVLLDHARACRVDPFVHISTDEVYGSLATGSADEDAPMAPNSPYSAAKASGDLLARSYWKTYGYPVKIVRSSNNFGPYQFPEKVIPLFITNLLEGKKVPLYGKGENRREWIYVEDNCDAIQIVFDKGEPGEIYNISAGNEISNRELTTHLLKALGAGDERIDYVQDRPGHDFRYSIKTDKLNQLGFKPRWNFHEALKQTITWYQSNPQWWKPLKRDKFTLK